jgi:endonuclease/exonuclease/phosphatase family metal-dependent hydrolase
MKNIVIVILIINIKILFSFNFKVMSYNIRYPATEDYKSGNGWNDRKFGLVKMLHYHQPDVIGMQEVVYEQLEFLSENLNRYNWFGVGRDDGEKKGEFTPIFYDTTKFNFIEGKNFWLSETPVIPSKGWDAALNRIVTMVMLEFKLSKKRFYVVNTHLDHKGEIAREKSAKLIIKEIIKLNNKYPVILTGDFNTVPKSIPYNIIVNILNDSYLITKTYPYGPDGTSSGFSVCQDIKLNRIDYIFVSSDIEVLSYANLTDSYNKNYYSDHLPVIVKIEIKD